MGEIDGSLIQPTRDYFKPPPKQEQGRERRLREKCEVKLNRLLEAYRLLKRGGILVSDCQLEFTPHLKSQIQVLQNDWEKFCKYTHDYKSKVNADPSGLGKSIEQDFTQMKLHNWTSFLIARLHYYGIEDVPIPVLQKKIL